MEELYLILIGGGVSFFTQVFKKVFKKIDPMLIVAILSVLVGGAYALLRKYGLITTETLHIVKYMFASAIVVFNVLKHIEKKARKVVDGEVPAPPIVAQVVPEPTGDTGVRTV